MWSKERKATERAIGKFVHLSQQARANQEDAIANAYERAIRILRVELDTVDQAKASVAVSAKTTMEVRVGSCTVLYPESVDIEGDKYHVVLTENEMGELVIRTVEGRFWFQALDTRSIVLATQPYPSPEREPISELRK